MGFQITPNNDLEERVIESLKKVEDPEIPVNIFDLGLIYKLDAEESEGKVSVQFTLTNPGCPVAGTFPFMVKEAVETVEGVKEVEVDLTFDPPWEPSFMSDMAKVALDMW